MLKSDSYALVKFQQTRRNDLGVLRGVGEGRVVQRGNKRHMMAEMKKAGGSKAGYFVYLTDTSIGGEVKP